MFTIALLILSAFLFPVAALVGLTAAVIAGGSLTAYLIGYGVTLAVTVVLFTLFTVLY